MPEGPIEAKKGDIFLYSPRTPHNFGTRNASWETLWCHFLIKQEWESLLGWPRISEGVGMIEASTHPVFKRILYLAGKIVKHLHVSTEFSRRFAMNSMEELLLTIASSGFLPGRPMQDDRLTRALEFIASDLPKVRKVEQLASIAGMSVSRFQHLFKKELHCTPIEYLEARRMERAKIRLAATSEPIESIAFSVGYTTPQYFYRRFKRTTGSSPGAFRKTAARPSE